MSELRSKDENINRQSALKNVIEYCKLTGKTDLSVAALFKLTYLFSENCMYANDKDEDFKKLIKATDEWLKEKK